MTVIVVGGGAAGMLAALTAAQRGAAVTLIETNQKVGRKLYITGKGRCNLTNDCPADEMLSNVPHNSRFLTSAVTRFPPSAVMEFFTGLGVPLKTERGNRVFPQSDKAADVIDALFFSLRRQRVNIVEDRAERLIIRDGKLCGVKTAHSFYSGDAVILATGGASYPLTGSTGDGYDMAADVGHTIVPLKPCLIALVGDGELCARMQGLSLRNVNIKIKTRKGKLVYTEQGEMLFTHFGLSGPLILSGSAHMRDFDREKYTVVIDLKPALDEATLDARLVRELGENANRAFHNVMDKLVPKLMSPVLVELSEIPGDIQCNSVTKVQRRRLLELLKGLEIPIKCPRPVSEAIVTSGGVKTGEIDPKTMASKLVPGLFFAGELIDVDAYTGGFNLQIAWSTGRAAGESAAEFT